MILVAVAPAQAQDVADAEALSKRLDLPLLEPMMRPVDCAAYRALLWVDGDALSLVQTGRGAPGPVAVEFGNAAMRHRRKGGQNELLGKAVGVGKKPALRVLDATAGLGRDAFVLADLGCDVHLCEREPLLAELLRSGLHRGRSSGDPWLQQVASRLHLHALDVRQVDAAVFAGVDTLYLDPMFPQRGKSASVKKEMALFQALLDDEGASEEADDLLPWALSQPVARVVVKRPAKAPFLGGVAPSHQVSGKAVRYDVHVKRALNQPPS